MQPYDPDNNYTPDEVKNALLGKNGSSRDLSFRYELLDKDNVIQRNLTYVLGGSVSNNALADIKRKAKFTIDDREVINYLADRIKPYTRLEMPVEEVWLPTGASVTNYAKNPKALGVVSGDAIPDFATYSTGTGEAGTTYALTNQIDGPTSRITSYARRVIDTGKTAGSTGWQATSTIYRVDKTGGAGDTITASIWVRYGGLGTTPVHLRVTAHGVTGTAAGANGESGTVDLVNDQWTRISATTTTTGDYVTVSWWLYQFGGEIIDGPGFQTLDVAGLVINEGDAAIDYFDGSFSDGVGPGYAYEWTGTMHDSASTKTELVKQLDGRRGYVEWPLGVFLLTTPSRTLVDGSHVVRNVDAYDQLLVLQDDKVTDRYTVAAGAVYTTAIDTLAGSMLKAITASALTVPVAMEWEPGTSKLRIINDLLGAINYKSAFFDENGRLVCQPYISPAGAASQWNYTTDSSSVISGDIEQTIDLFDIPNSWVLVVSEPDRPAIVGSYTNSSPSSLTSTVSRGRTVVDFRTEQDAADQVTLDAKAARLAYESSQVYEIITFNTALMPIHGDADVFNLTVDGLVLADKYSEHEWSLVLAAGSTMSHKVRRIVNLGV